MFFVADGREAKKYKIMEYLTREPMISVLLAAANFEWTVGRCILFLSKSPNRELRERLAAFYDLDRYKDLWRNELKVSDPSIPFLTEVIRNWKEFKEAFLLRHRLIHGRGTCSRNMASKPVEIMLEAIDALYNFALWKGKDLHNRLPIRRKKK